jgi:hypothetical protein
MRRSAAPKAVRSHLTLPFLDSGMLGLEQEPFLRKEGLNDSSGPPAHRLSDLQPASDLPRRCFRDTA